jgi:hypothetical protein
MASGEADQLPIAVRSPITAIEEGDDRSLAQRVRQMEPAAGVVGQLKVQRSGHSRHFNSVSAKA